MLRGALLTVHEIRTKSPTVYGSGCAYNVLTEDEASINAKVNSFVTDRFEWFPGLEPNQRPDD
jgi:hypothetical protein